MRNFEVSSRKNTAGKIRGKVLRGTFWKIVNNNNRISFEDAIRQGLFMEKVGKPHRESEIDSEKI